MTPSSPQDQSGGLRVLAVMPTGQVRGGAEQMLIQAIQYRPTAADWTVVVLEPGPIVSLLETAGAHAEVFEGGRLREPLRVGRTIRHLRRLLRSGAFDIAVGWMTKAQLYLGPAGLGLDVPTAWYQLSTPHARSWIDRAGSTLPASAVLTLSADGYEAQRRFTRAPVELVYPGADLERFDPSRLDDPATMRRSLGLRSASLTIGIVGRLQRWKGMHVFLDAMRQVVDAHPDVLGVLVGGDHPLERAYANDLQAQCERLGLQDSIHFAGPQPDVERWMQAMDIVVHASDREPFGIVIIEAMALGKPVVVGSAGGPAEIIDDGADGLLSPYGDAYALAAHLLRLIADPALRESLGSAARTTAQRFGANTYARNLHQILAGVIERGGAG